MSLILWSSVALIADAGNHMFSSSQNVNSSIVIEPPCCQHPLMPTTSLLYSVARVLPYEVWIRIAQFASEELYALALTSSEVTWPAYDLLYRNVVVDPDRLFAAAVHWINGEDRVLRRIRSLKIHSTNDQDCQLTNAHFDHRFTIVPRWPKMIQLFSLTPVLTRLTLSGLILGPGLPGILLRLQNLTYIALRRLCIPSDTDIVWRLLSLPSILQLELTIVCWHDDNRDFQFVNACGNITDLTLSWHSDSYLACHDCVISPHHACLTITISTNYGSWPSDHSISGHRRTFVSFLRSFRSLSHLRIKGCIPTFSAVDLDHTPLSNTLQSYQALDRWILSTSGRALHCICSLSTTGRTESPTQALFWGGYHYFWGCLVLLQ
ncbi:uncharacterized protein C8R40DRAFT_1166905 [Lentinula edodes]|uniref:uncharacterized protein n=1 Tax=Lentinula edodes TaxID=5353 RepID=UPI001E8E478B|nr:uncharacterized protein C8R40DRAFT_1166905 [Lentinula edodes]KAH7878933.1 hypothetical protein C8R40DRAFT_1166905 [Lentinula edodes]